MAQLTKTYPRPSAGEGSTDETQGKARADVIYFTGGIVCADSAGRIVLGADDASLEPAGILSAALYPQHNEPEFHLDNTGGPDGVWQGGAYKPKVLYSRSGLWFFPDDAITGTPIEMRSRLYILNDYDVQVAPTLSGVNIGIVVRRARANYTDGWYVNISEKGVNP